jgi:adenylate cyclase
MQSGFFVIILKRIYIEFIVTILQNLIFKRKGIISEISLILMLVFLLRGVGWLDWTENQLLDFRFQIRGPAKLHPDLALVDISDDALEEFGGWPFPRHFHGMFIDAATNLGVSQIVYDLFFSRATNEESDNFMGQMAAMSGSVIFPFRLSPEAGSSSCSDAENLLPPNFFAKVPASFNKPWVPAYGLMEDPLPQVLFSSSGMGFVNTLHDPDGMSRRIPVAYQCDRILLFPLVLPAALKANNLDLNAVRFESSYWPQFPGNSNPSVFNLPMDATGSMLINWAGKWVDLPHYSFREIIVSYKQQMEGEPSILSAEDLAGLKNKILIVGSVHKNSHDYYPTPFENQHYLPGLQFSVLNMLLTQNFILPVNPWIEVLIMITILFLLAEIIHSSTHRFRQILFPLSILITGIISVWLFTQYNIWYRMADLAIAVSVFMIAFNFRSYMEEYRSKLAVKSAFSKYVTTDVMEKLLADPNLLKPGGELKDVTVMFSDIRGFTSYSEKLTATEIVKQLNEYLEAMTPLIFEQKGTIDKLVGDEIMAYFGAPLYPENHPERAIITALRMQKKLEDLRLKWRSEGKHSLEIGIGISTGQVVLGNIGSSDYMDFTLIGDVVNLGARLCSMAEPGEILISQGCYDRVLSQVSVKQAKRVHIKGKSGLIEIYSVQGFSDRESIDRRRHLRVRVPLSINIRLAEDSTYSEETLVNISGGGFMAQTQKAFPDGAEILINIDFPNGIQIKNLPAQILECRQTAEGWAERGVFTGIGASDREEILKYVESHADDPGAMET